MTEGCCYCRLWFKIERWRHLPSSLVVTVPQASAVIINTAKDLSIIIIFLWNWVVRVYISSLLSRNWSADTCENELDAHWQLTAKLSVVGPTAQTCGPQCAPCCVIALSSLFYLNCDCDYGLWLWSPSCRLHVTFCQIYSTIVRDRVLIMWSF